MQTKRRDALAPNPGLALVAALAERDFRRLAETLAPEIRMRALIPPGPIELSGAEAAVAKFSAWFAGAEKLEVLLSGSDEVSDRLHVFYRLRVKRTGDPWKIVEQHCLCAVSDGRIMALDLVCTGFRPDAARAARMSLVGNEARTRPTAAAAAARGSD